MSLSGDTTLQYFANEKLCGTSQIYCCAYSESGVTYSAHWPHHALFCKTCGELWGRIVFIYHFTYEPQVKSVWKVWEKACEKCGGGELLHDDWLANADKELLTRELNILLMQYEKGLI